MRRYKGDRLRRRLLRHHLLLPEGTRTQRLSIATAYVALALLALTLLIGPWRVLRRRPLPLSSDLRRDTGIWTAIVSLVHVVVGLQVHLGGRIAHYFLEASGSGSGTGAPRTDDFGFANHTGLAATLVVILLLALSNDRSLRWFGPRRWKALHRSAYALFALVVAHALLYQDVEDRAEPVVWLFGLAVTAVVALQLAGAARRAASRR
jgi:methionine sulfoxide reductase heme-binding subunit